VIYILQEVTITEQRLRSHPQAPSYIIIIMQIANGQN